MPVPDEKTMQMLSRATRERPVRTRNVVIVVIAGLLFLLILGAFSVEAWRQNQIRSARHEVEQAVAGLRADYAPVSDWRAWYAGRVKGRDGSPEYRAWVNAHAGASREEQFDTLKQWAEGGPAPDPAFVQKCIADTQACEVDALGLLDFDSLGGIPELEHGYPKSDVLQNLTAFSQLQARALALACDGRIAQAWSCAALMLDLAARMGPPTSLVHSMVIQAHEARALSVFTLLCNRLAPPMTLAERFPLPMPADNTPTVLEAEAVFVVQLAGNGHDFDEMLGESAWFDWMRADSPYRGFNGMADAIRAEAEWVHTLRALARCAREGGPWHEPVSEWGRGLASRPAIGRADLALHRAGANLAAAARKAEAAGIGVAEFVPDPAVYKVLSSHTQPDGTRVLTWEFTDAEKAKYASPFCELSELFDAPQTLRLKPLR